MTSGIQPDRLVGSADRRRGRPREIWFWVVMATGLFVVYAATFSPYSVIERKVSVVGESDAASYVRLWRDFRFDRPLGDPFVFDGRTLDDVAEKHRLHHVLAAGLGHVLGRAFEAIYDSLGLPRRTALYAVSALWGAANVVLLGLLMRRWNSSANPVWPFLVLYGFSMTPWVFASVPDSWALTAGLFLVLLVLASHPRVPPFASAVALGIFMLNNMALGAALVFLWLDRWRAVRRVGPVVRQAAGLAGAAVLTWVAGLTLLGLLDPNFRLDRFLAHSARFREFMGATLPPWSLYVWKSMLTNLFMNSLVTQQPDPNVPQEALLYTLQGSWLGRLAVLAMVALMATTIYRLGQAARGWKADGESLADVVTRREVAPIIFCGVMIAVTYALYYPSGFIYASLVVPLLALIFHRFLDLGRRGDRAVVAVGTALLVVNNVAQILEWRAVLATAN